MSFYEAVSLKSKESLNTLVYSFHRSLTYGIFFCTKLDQISEESKMT